MFYRISWLIVTVLTFLNLASSYSILLTCLNNSYGTLDIIDDRIYLTEDAGITSYDKNLGNVQFIINNWDN